MKTQFHFLNGFEGCWFTTVAKDSQHAGSVFGIRKNQPNQDTKKLPE